MLLESKLESTQWNSLCKSFQDNLIRWEKKPTYSFGTQLKDFTISIIFMILILGSKDDASFLQTQSLLKQHQGKNLKCLKVILSVLLVQSPYVVMVTGGRSNWRPWRGERFVLYPAMWTLGLLWPAALPRVQLSGSLHANGGHTWAGCLSSPSRLNYRRGWLLFLSAFSSSY